MSPNTFNIACVIEVTFKDELIFSTRHTSFLATETILKLFVAKFPARDGFHIAVYVSLPEVSYYKTPNDFFKTYSIKKAPGREE